MNVCFRGSAPELLDRYGYAIGQEYAAKRRANPSHTFQWPQREGQSVYTVAKTALEVMTQRRCAYCDGHPITAMGEDQIDHFRPKSREEFYELVCAWDNLFLICSACNKAKLNKWDNALLRPDEPGFSFSRFFTYRTDTGALEPNAAGSSEDRHRSQRTIEILDLNRIGACEGRRQMVRLILAAVSDEDLANVGCRYLIPLCRPALESGSRVT